MKICYIPPKTNDKANDNLYYRTKLAYKYFYTAAIMLVASNNILAKSTNDPLKDLGGSAISYFQYGLTVLAIIMALLESGKAMIEGDPKRIPSIVAKYGIGVICIYAIPFGYFKITEAFTSVKDVMK